MTWVTGNPASSAELAAVDTLIDGVDTLIDGFIAATERCVEKTDGAVLNGADALFTVAGGPVLCQIYGMVTTLLDGAATCRLSLLPTDPAVKVELNNGAVAIDAAAVGTLIYNVGATSVLTPVAAGAVKLDPVTVEPTWFLLTPGVVSATFSAARAGVIRWFCVYKPLSPLSTVTMAA